MSLIPKELADKIPRLYEQDGLGLKATCHAKLSTPDSNWSWFVTEYDPSQRLCFGLVDGFEKELGYFSLTELESLRGPLGLPIERDLYFKETSLEKIMRDKV